MTPEPKTYLDKQAEALREEISEAHSATVKLGILAATAIGIIWNWLFQAELQCTAAVWGPFFVLVIYILILIGLQIAIDRIGLYLRHLESRLDLPKLDLGYEFWCRKGRKYMSIVVSERVPVFVVVTAVGLSMLLIVAGICIVYVQNHYCPERCDAMGVGG